MVPTVSSDTVDTHEILTNRGIEEVTSALVLWIEFKLETLFTNKIQNKYLMIFIFNKILTLLDAYRFSRNKSCCVGYCYIQKWVSTNNEWKDLKSLELFY